MAKPPLPPNSILSFASEETNAPRTHTDHPVISGIGWGILLGAISGIAVSICTGFLQSWAGDIFPNSPLVNLLWITPLLWAVGAGWIFWRKQAYFAVAFGATSFIFSVIALLILAAAEMLGGTA